MADFLLFLLITVSCHRLWHYEAVFEIPRRLVAHLGVWGTPLTCSNCSPIWLGLGAALALGHPWPLAFAWTVAVYPVLRLLAALYRTGLPWAPPARPARGEALQEALDRAVAKASGGTSGSKPACTTCGSNAPPLGVDADVVIGLAANLPAQLVQGAVRLAAAVHRAGVGVVLVVPSDLRAATADDLDVALTKAGLPPEASLVLFGPSRLEDLDMLVLPAGAKDEALRAAAAGVIPVLPEPLPGDVDPAVAIANDLSNDGRADSVVSYMLVGLVGSPAYKARKAASRSRPASPSST